MLLSRHWLNTLLCFVSGALTVFGSAPFHLWPLLILPLGFTIYLSRANPLQLCRFVLAFFAGFFAIGVSWVAIPIHIFGHTPPIIAALLTATFILFLALLSTAPFYALKRFHLSSIWLWPIGFTLAEALRCYTFTGFPWLLLGYGHIDSPLGNFLPWVGPMGVTFISVCASVLLAKEHRFSSAVLLLALFAGAIILPNLYSSPTVTTQGQVALLQGNIPQAQKWQEAERNIDTYIKLWKQSVEADLVFFPETAFEMPRQYADVLLVSIDEKAQLLNQGVIIGLPDQLASSEVQNILLALGSAQGSYAKRQLVPFGEYVPFGLRGVIDLLSIPIFDMVPGTEAALLETNYGAVLPTICYEVGFIDLWRDQVPFSVAILSVVNNAWFGHSLASWQQFQMVRALAKTVARPIYQAGNTGITAVVGTNGQVLHQLPPFTEGRLSAPFITSANNTAFTQVGYFPLWFVIILLTISLLCYENKKGS